MYTPAHFQVADEAQIRTVMQRHSFAVLTTAGPGGLMASHLPFLYDAGVGERGTLFAHLARANPQWREFSAGVEAMVVFQGEHGYISPTWYANQPPTQQVPTWNYEAVHAYGVPRITEDRERTVQLLEATIRNYEAPGSGYSVHLHTAEFLDRMTRAIVAFEIPVTRLEAKFKLSQNRTKEDAASAIGHLERTGDPAAARLAAAMRQANAIGQSG